MNVMLAWRRLAVLFALMAPTGHLAAAETDVLVGTVARGNFTAWWTPLMMSHVPSDLRQRCGREGAAKAPVDCRHPDTVVAWCTCYTNHLGAPATQLDLPGLLSAPPLALAAFVGARDAVIEPLRAWVELTRAETTNRAPWLRAALLEVDNVARPTASPVFPGIDLGAIDRVLAGVYAAIEEQAQQEAVAFAVQALTHDWCNDALLRDGFLSTTCAANAAGAFTPGRSTSGASALALLQKTIGLDVRAFPATLAGMLVAQDPNYAPVADATRLLVREVIAGATAQGALERFSERVMMVMASSSIAAEQPAVQAIRGADPHLMILACAAQVPAAAALQKPLVRAASSGLVPALTEADERLAVLALATLQPACQGLYAGRNPLALWLAHHESMLAASDRLVLNTPANAEPPEVIAAAFATVEAAWNTIALWEGVSASPPSPQRIGGLLQMANLVATAATGDLVAVYQGLLRLGLGPEALVQIPEPLVESAGLLVTIAEAESAEQVKAVLLDLAAVGWRSKYVADRRLVSSVAGLVGFGADWRDHRVAPRVTASLGVDVILPISSQINVGLFLQLLDLGGYSTYLANGLSQPRVLQALSPGAMLRVGLLRLPLVAVAGMAYDVDAGNRLFPGQGAWRGMVGFGLDATLWVISR